MTRTVLVVDDEPDVRMMARLRLERAGWNVLEAPDGDTALAAFGPTVDAVLVDQRMPGRTGIELGKMLRGQGFEGPILVFSAYLNPQLEQETAAHGMATLSKASVSDLVATLTGLADDPVSRSGGPSSS